MSETEQQIDDFFTDFKAPEQTNPPQIEEPEVEEVKLKPVEVYAKWVADYEQSRL